MNNIYKDLSDERFPVSPILDIKVAQPHMVYKRSSQLVKMEEKRQKLLMRFKRTWNSTVVPSMNMSLGGLQAKFEEILLTRKSIKELDDPNYYKDAKSCLKIIKELRSLKESIKEFEDEIRNLRQSKRKINSVFVTLRKRTDKDLFMQFFPRHGLLRLFSCFRGASFDPDEVSRMGSQSDLSIFQKAFKKSVKKKLKTRQITVKEPVDPLNINWMQLDRSFLSLFFIRLATWSFYITLYIGGKSLVLCCLAFYVFVLFKRLKMRYKIVSPNCSVFSSVLTRDETFDMVETWDDPRKALNCLCGSESGFLDEE